LRMAASLQSASEHPLGRAVLAVARQRGLAFPEPVDVQAVPGRGNQGQVDGRRYLMGSLRWMQELALDLGPLAAVAHLQQGQGATVSVLAERTADGLRACALLAFADEPKPQARQALAALRARGLSLVMI